MEVFQLLMGFDWDDVRLANLVQPDDGLDLQMSVLQRRGSKSRLVGQ
jgi:hypothetical protein